MSALHRESGRETDNTLQLIATQVEAKLTADLETLSEYDTKAVVVLGVSGALAGLVLGSELLLQAPTLSWRLVVLAGPALATVAAIVALSAFWPREWRRDPNVHQLWRKYRGASVQTVTEQIIANQVESIRVNRRMIQRKLGKLKAALGMAAGAIVVSSAVSAYLIVATRGEAMNGREEERPAATEAPRDVPEDTETAPSGVPTTPRPAGPAATAVPDTGDSEPQMPLPDPDLVDYHSQVAEPPPHTRNEPIQVPDTKTEPGSED